MVVKSENMSNQTLKRERISVNLTKTEKKKVQAMARVSARSLQGEIQFAVRRHIGDVK